ncbi:hypothetical protein [Paractinoplanes hotanensis]|uniref:Tetratricopeptide repeat protein n=1 Tax=Paractinoplanes hotanensis TaxID=2906497 RepID=A0ABT0Y0C5_9ACTN|nr:hypothetical protein [Actinoplanes hotanensis]MCM4078933.1 hypothetical protein [Actinoplanes hotanensis]
MSLDDGTTRQDVSLGRVRARGDVVQVVTQIAGRRPGFALGPPAAPKPVGAGLGPSAWLVAANEIVPYVGRDSERAEVAAWLVTDAPVAARLMTAPGGQGKTRLARQCAREAADWDVLVARHRLDGGGLAGLSGTPRQFSSSGRPEHGESRHGTLILVDYADRWPQDDLLTLFEDPTVQSAADRGRLRFLLLARSGAFWWTLADLLGAAGVAASRRELGDLPAGDGQRRHLFETAAGAFASSDRLNLDPSAIPFPDDLSAECFSTPLAVQYSALAAALAVHDGLPGAQAARYATDPATASRNLIRREVRAWRRLAEPGVAEPVRCSVRVLARTVFVLALTGGAADDQAAVRLLDRVQRGPAQDVGAPTRTLVDDHRRCYPPPTPSAGLVALLPDRLAEDFVAALLGATGDGPHTEDSLADLADPFAATALDRLLTPGPGAADAGPGGGQHGPFVVDKHAPAVVRTLAEAAQRWPEVAVRHLSPALRRDPDLAPAAGAVALTRISALEELADLLPAVGDAAYRRVATGRHEDLVAGAVAVQEAVVARVRRDAADPADLEHLFSLLFTLWALLGRLGRRAEAVPVMREMVGLGRRLSAAGSDASERHLVLLGWAVDALVIALMDVGRADEAAVVAEEAVALARQLPDDGRWLADALSNQATALELTGRTEEAVEAMAAAAGEFRRRADSAGADGPDRYLPVAAALGNQARMLLDLGRTAHGLAVQREAVAVGRRAADPRDGDPDAGLPVLAHALGVYAAVLASSGRAEQAVTAATESVEILRQLPTAEPADAPRADLAAALTDLARLLVGAGRPVDGAASAAEAVELRRLLADPAVGDPVIRLPGLAESLLSHSDVLAAVGEHHLGLAASREAVAIGEGLRDAAAGDQETARFVLARALATHSNRLAGCGEPQQALAAARASIELARELADPERGNRLLFGPMLAEFLRAYAHRSAATALPDESVVAWREAVLLCRETVSSWRSANALKALAITVEGFPGEGSSAEALDAAREAVTVRRRLAEYGEGDQSEARESLLAALRGLAARLETADESGEDLAVGRERVDVLQELAADEGDEPREWSAQLMLAQIQYAGALTELDRPDEALVVSRETVALAERLPVRSPRLVFTAMARSLEAKSLSLLGRADEALRAVEESVQIIRRADSEVSFSGVLPYTFTVHAEVLHSAGRTAEACETLREGLARHQATSASGEDNPTLRGLVEDMREQLAGLCDAEPGLTDL